MIYLHEEQVFAVKFALHFVKIMNHRFKVTVIFSGIYGTHIYVHVKAVEDNLKWSCFGRYYQKTKKSAYNRLTLIFQSKWPVHKYYFTLASIQESNKKCQPRSHAELLQLLKNEVEKMPMPDDSKSVARLHRLGDVGKSIC